MFLFLFLVENRVRHVTVIAIRALSMESLSDQRENIGRLALSVCERERFWFEAPGEVKSGWISWCVLWCCLRVMMMMGMMEMVVSK